MNFSCLIFERFCFNLLFVLNESEAKCPNTLILYTTGEVKEKVFRFVEEIISVKNSGTSK